MYNIPEFLLHRIIIDSLTNCWLIGNKNKHIHIWYNNKNIYFHRLMMHILTGFDLNSELHILHKRYCPNKNCGNPNHLYVGTEQDNTNDKLSTGYMPFRKELQRRKEITHCKNGHEFTKENSYEYKKQRTCKTCARINSKNRYYKNRSGSGVKDAINIT